MNLKNVAFNVLLFVLCSSSLYAGGFIKAGETFKATEDVRYFNKAESVDLLNKLNRLDEVEKMIVLYKENESKYKMAIAEKDNSIASYKESLTYLEFSVKQYKTLAEDLQTIVKAQTGSMIELTKTIMSNSNRRAKTNFFTGFLERIVVAWGLSRIK